MNSKFLEFIEACFLFFKIFVIPLSIILCVAFIINELPKAYYYKYVYEYEDLDGNVGISDNCSFFKDSTFFKESDNQVCFISNVKTLVKTIEIYGVKQCYSDNNCGTKIYTDLDSLLDYHGQPYHIYRIKK